MEITPSQIKFVRDGMAQFTGGAVEIPREQYIVICDFALEAYRDGIERAAKWHEERADELDRDRASLGKEKIPEVWSLHHRADASSIRRIFSKFKKENDDDSSF